MCGIVGIYGDDLNVQANAKKDFIAQAALADSVRGHESTGMFVMSRFPKHDGHRMYKRALAGYDFIQLKGVNKIIESMHSCVAMVVHNRQSTRGAVSDGNAHPFRFGDITLVHNGTVTNGPTLVSKKERPDTLVDSAFVAHALSLEDADDVLPRLEGGYSLVWHDASDNSLHFARNSAKPMFLAFDPTRETMYFGSEMLMLLWLTDRNNLSIQDEVYSLTPNTHFIFRNPKNVREIERRPFVQYSRRKVSPTPPAHRPPTVWTPSTTPTGSGGEATKHPVSEETIVPAVANVIQTATAKSEERVARLKNHLAKEGLMYGEPVVCVPRMWKPYETQEGESTPKNRVGVMLLYREGDPDQRACYQVFGVQEAKWIGARPSTNYKLEIINYREKLDFEKHGPIFVCRIVEEIDEKKDQAASGQQPTTTANEPHAADKFGAIFVEVGTSRKRSVHPFVYDELTRNGCINCRAHLPVSVSRTIHWIGNNDDIPLCEQCANNSTILNSMANYH